MSGRGSGRSIAGWDRWLILMAAAAKSWRWDNSVKLQRKTYKPSKGRKRPVKKIPHEIETNKKFAQDLWDGVRRFVRQIHDLYRIEFWAWALLSSGFPVCIDLRNPTLIFTPFLFYLNNSLGEPSYPPHIVFHLIVS